MQKRRKTKSQSKPKCARKGRKIQKKHLKKVRGCASEMEKRHQEFSDLAEELDI